MFSKGAGSIFLHEKKAYPHLITLNNTLMIQNDAKNLKSEEILAHGYSSENILSESYPLNINMTGL